MWEQAPSEIQSGSVEKGYRICLQNRDSRRQRNLAKINCNQSRRRHSVLLPDTILSKSRSGAKEYKMSNTISDTVPHGVTIGDSVSSTPSWQAFQILRLGFVAAPVLAGIDKFFHLLTNWDKYLSPAIANLSPIGGHGLMSAIGVIEIAAGVLVAVKPRIGAYVVAGWLLGIVINLLLIPGYFDVALRDFGLSLGALALARLSVEFSS
jgi:hypothetical protein